MDIVVGVQSSGWEPIGSLVFLVSGRLRRNPIVSKKLVAFSFI
jgi:hypothetical protein